MKLASLAALISAIAMISVAFMGAHAQPSPTPSARMNTHHAKGTFEVTMKPLPPLDAGADDKLARMSLDKSLRGTWSAKQR